MVECFGGVRLWILPLANEDATMSGPPPLPDWASWIAGVMLLVLIGMLVWGGWELFVFMVHQAMGS